jgi:hypothetical protein
MPQFVLNIGGGESRRTFTTLDAFTRGYLEAMFFTESGNDDLGADVGLDDLSAEAWDKVRADCATFQEMASATLEQAYAHPSGYDDDRAGNDFWYTRNGHGTGFWDRGLDAIGNQLNAAAKSFGTTDLYSGDDMQLYLS